MDPHFIRKVGAGVNMLTLKVFSDKYPTALENIKHLVHSSTNILGGFLLCWQDLGSTNLGEVT